MFKTYSYYAKCSSNFQSLEFKCIRKILTCCRESFKVSFSNPCRVSKYLLSEQPVNSEALPLHLIKRCFSQINDDLRTVNRNLNNSENNECRPSNQGAESDNRAGCEEEEGDRLFDNIDYEEITGGDIDNINRFKLFLLEVDVLRQDGLKVPTQLSTDNWKELFSLHSRSQRRKFLAFLWTNEIKKLAEKRKKDIKKQANLEKRAEQIKENENNDHIHYGFQGNTIFQRVYDTTIDAFENSRLIQAMVFGQNIVVDCGYDKDMTIMENKLCAKQLMLMFADNRSHKEPFNLQFCNMNRDSVLFKQLSKFIPKIDDPSFPIIVSEDHYLNMFPKENLVYLTPHCHTELKEFSHDDIYIIGALVDKINCAPLSMAKAKSEGIRMAQLPLDRYLQWALGGKSLTVNQVLKIILDLRSSGDWNTALKNVPQRKLRQPNEPVQDMRKFYNRGTTFQPPISRRNKGFM